MYYSLLLIIAHYYSLLFICVLTDDPLGQLNSREDRDAEMERPFALLEAGARHDDEARRLEELERVERVGREARGARGGERRVRERDRGEEVHGALGGIA